MLVLSRRLHEKILIPAVNTSIQVVAVKSGVIRLGIEAPAEIKVFREEVLTPAALAALAPAPPPALAPDALRQLMHLLNNRLNASTIGLTLLRHQLELGRHADAVETLGKLDNEMKTLKEQLARLNQPSTPAPAPRARCRALLVEDDRNECELLAGYLRLAGVEVETAEDGANALDYLRTHKDQPNVVLLDMVLPRCDGPTFVRTLRGDPAYAGLKIFGMTGHNLDQFGLTEGPAGVDRWYRKPLNPEALLRELRQTACSPHAPREEDPSRGA
jgi:carbon storage regulator CsrA